MATFFSPFLEVSLDKAFIILLKREKGKGKGKRLPPLLFPLPFSRIVLELEVGN